MTRFEELSKFPPKHGGAFSLAASYMLRKASSSATKLRHSLTNFRPTENSEHGRDWRVDSMSDVARPSFYVNELRAKDSNTVRSGSVLG
jgi:hypothetical protein